MKLSEYKNIYSNEETHFYYLGYQAIVISLLKKYLAKKPVKILDAGCGTGYLTKQLEQFGEVIGIDSSSEAIKYAKKRGVNVVKASLLKLPFRSGSFDLVTSIDVLYHKNILNDHKALEEIYRVLKPNGLFLVKLPAFDFLYSNHDRKVLTKKRYNKNELTTLLKKSNMKTLKTSYLGSFLFFPALIKIILEKMSNNINPHSGIKRVWAPLNFLLTFLFKIENMLLESINIPFGISVMAIAKK